VGHQHGGQKRRRRDVLNCEMDFLFKEIRVILRFKINI
jgi:hypothetical protein